MSYHLKSFFAIVPMLFSIVGCISIPKDTEKNGFSVPPSNGTGRILISAYYVPIKSNAFAELIGGGTTPLRPTVYDVTKETKYLGAIRSSGSKNDSTWIEYDAQPGKHLLMLHDYVFPKTEVIDFIEVMVTPGDIQHIAISQYGGADRSFFVKMNIDQTAYDFCTKKLPGSEFKFLHGYTALTEFIKENNIPNERHVFSKYCISLQNSPRVRYPSETSGVPEVEKQKIEAARIQGLPRWDSLQDRTPPYDLLNK